MTVYICPHLSWPPVPPYTCHAEAGERVVCLECAKVLTYDMRRAWLVAPECIDDCEPGAEYAVMAPPPCGNRGRCDRPIERDGYCMECWPLCHTVECRVSDCPNYVPMRDAEEWGGYCGDHRPTRRTS